MHCCLAELRNKEVIDKNTGCRLGNVDDIEVDTCSGCLHAIVIYGNRKMFGFFGNCEDLRIPWKNIDVIGDDTILVNCEFPASPKPEPRRRGGLFGPFNF